MSQQQQGDTSKAIAWVISIGLHIGCGVLAFFVTWTIIRSNKETPHRITPSWHKESVVVDASIPNVKETPLTITLDVPVIQEVIQSPVPDGYQVLESVQGAVQLPEFVKRTPSEEAKFMGLDAASAKSIVYVVDASGSMLLHLSVVLNELERSLQGLHPEQSFAILFFQKDKAIHVPPKGKLQTAHGNQIQNAMKWIRSSGYVIPSGSSNPVTALRAAIRLRPDVVYLLSENITGSGKHAIEPSELLKALEKLNPIDVKTGKRQIEINCIQYLTHDPKSTMKQIASIHGGEDGYTFISRGTVSD